MHYKKILNSGFAILVLLAGSYLIYQNFQEFEKPYSEKIKIGEVKIQPDRDNYTPLLSSTVGIGLTPIYTPSEHPETVKFRWYANYGHFVSWGPPDFRVNLLGSEVINNGEKIFWSYDPDKMGIIKSTVKISLRLEDAESGQFLGESIIEIDWADQDVAIVKK